MRRGCARGLQAHKLTALNKPSGDVRAIAAPSLLRRLAGRALCATCTPPFAQHCRDAMATLAFAGSNEQGEATSDVLDWTDWVLQPRKKLQNVLSMRLDKQLHTILLGSLDAPSKARLHSFTGPLAAAWQ